MSGRKGMRFAPGQQRPKRVCEDANCKHAIGAHHTSQTAANDAKGARCSMPGCRCGGFR